MGKAARVQAVDVVRGFAVLGILKINIAGFALPYPFGPNLNARGDMQGMNLALWWVDSLLAEGRMRALFCLLFGAGLWLVASRRDDDEKDSFGDFWIRRNLWLTLFGMAHVYLLLWRWDILYWYGLMGLALFPFRNVAPRRILVVTALWFVVSAGITVLHYHETQESLVKGWEAAALDEKDVELTSEQKSALSTYEDQQRWTYPSKKEIDEEIENWRSGPVKLYTLAANYAVDAHRILPYGWDSLAVFFTMLLGIALLRLGILNGERDASFFRRLALVAYGVGLPAQAAVCWIVMKEGFDPHAFLSTVASGATYEPLRFLVAVGHVSVLILLLKAGRLTWLTSRLGAVGRMALSNYLLQTIICGFLFYGIGFRLYGSLDRARLYGICFAIWTFQLLVSPLWLARFQFGPAEWLWRALTRWELPPFRARPSVAAP